MPSTHSTSRLVPREREKESERRRETESDRGRGGGERERERQTDRDRQRETEREKESEQRRETEGSSGRKRERARVFAIPLAPDERVIDERYNYAKPATVCASGGVVIGLVQGWYPETCRQIGLGFYFYLKPTHTRCSPQSGSQNEVDFM